MAPGERTKELRYAGKVVPLALAFMLVMGAVAFADEADGDFAATTAQSVNVTAGTPYNLTVDLFVVRRGNNAVQTVSWGVFANTCGAGAAGAASPSSFTLPASWEHEANGKLSKALSPSILSTATIAGTAGAAGSSCSVTYTGTPSANFEGQGIPPGQRNVTFTINYVAPAPTNTAPVVAADNASVTVNEGSLAGMSGTWSDADSGDTVNLSASVGSVVKSGTNASGTWSWSYTPDDGPSDGQTVTITADDGTTSTTATFGLTVNNVAPTATRNSASSVTTLSGLAVNFNFTATDPSSADTAAGFEWRFDDGMGGGYSVYAAQTAAFAPSATYASCGSYTVTAQAVDKDGGESNEPSATINVFNGDFHGAIVPATRNLVQKGRVIPVQVRIGCGGVAETGLTPVIMLIGGDADPDTDSSDSAVLTPTTVSAADTTGVMRPTDSGYLYNLQVPSNAVAGQKYTILVRPWGSGATMKALIEIRK